ncbi:MAG: 4-hydroxyphenylacetate 3-hydroxylase N-terminal domain-containing protein [Bacillota bacterium]
MRTFEQYLAGLKKLRPNVYLGGRLVPRDDPVFLPGIKTIGSTFELAADPQYEELTTAVSTSIPNLKYLPTWPAAWRQHYPMKKISLNPRWAPC